MYDVESMLNACDIQQALEQLGIKFDTVYKSDATELYFECLNPIHESSKKCSIAASGKKKGMFYCWSCGNKGNLIHIIRDKKQCGFQIACDWLENLTGVGSVSGVEALTLQLERHKGEVQPSAKDRIIEIPVYQMPVDFKLCAENTDPDDLLNRQVLDFLRDRGIEKEEIEEFGIGTSHHPKIGGCVTIPIRSRLGTLNSIFYAQPWQGGLKRYPKGAMHKYFCFNEIMALGAEDIVVVESVLDAIKIQSMLGHRAIACFSNMITEEQCQWIRNANGVTICPDMDSDRGWDMVNRAVEYLGKEIQVAIPPTGKDPGDCNFSELSLAFENKVPYHQWEVDRSMAKIRRSRPSGGLEIRK